MACCTSLSVTVGTPKLLTPLSGFSISPLRIGRNFLQKTSGAKPLNSGYLHHSLLFVIHMQFFTFSKPFQFSYLIRLRNSNMAIPAREARNAAPHTTNVLLPPVSVISTLFDGMINVVTALSAEIPSVLSSLFTSSAVPSR